MGFADRPARMTVSPDNTDFTVANPVLGSTVRIAVGMAAGLLGLVAAAIVVAIEADMLI